MTKPTTPTMLTIAAPYPVKAARKLVSPSHLPRQHKQRWLALMLAGMALAAGNALADEVKVMNSGGFTAAYKALGPGFEKATGNTLSTAWGRGWLGHMRAQAK